MFTRPDQLDHPLYVVTPIFNSQRYRTRWKLYEDFAKMCDEAGAILYTVEVAFGDRHFSITQPDHPRHLQLRTNAEIWHKEDAINRVIERLPRDWQAVAWIDSDIQFARDDWANETLHALQHYDVVQMWSLAQDLNRDYEVIQTHRSFVASVELERPLPDGHEPYYYQSKPGTSGIIEFHPGFAWAARRTAFDQLGGLIDFAILGAADNHMARSLYGFGDRSMHRDVSPEYRAMVLRWQDRALRYIKKNVGLVPGTILHNWHGKKADRKYWDRWKILTECRFNPETDLKPDWQSLHQLVVEDERQIQLRDLIRRYFRQRNEDSIDE